MRDLKNAILKTSQEGGEREVKGEYEQSVMVCVHGCTINPIICKLANN